MGLRRAFPLSFQSDLPLGMAGVCFRAPNDDTIRANQLKGWDATPRIPRDRRATESRRSAPRTSSKGQTGIRSGRSFDRLGVEARLPSRTAPGSYEPGAVPPSLLRQVGIPSERQ